MKDIAYRYPLAELLDQECHDFSVDGIPLFLVNHQNKIYCYLNQCPHQGIELNWRPGKFLDLDKRHIQCFTHGALFDMVSGRCIAGPCIDDHLESVEVAIVQNEIVIYRAALPSSDVIIARG